MKKIEPFQQLEPFPKPEPINERIDDINDNFAKIKTALAEAGNALPSDIVTSVNSKTGDVVLAWKDIAGEPTVDGGLAVKGGLTLDAQDVGDVPGNKAATQDYVAKMISAKAAPADHVGSGGEDQHMLATNETAGFMSPADKAKLDNLPDQVVSAVESVNGQTGVVNLQFSDIQGKLQTTGAELGDSAAATQPAGNATNKIATTKFVHDAINESGVPRSHIGSGGNAHAIVTKDAAGFMSPEQLAKLDGLSELAEGGNAVVSVNGQTGAVVLDAGAVGARPSDWMPPEATPTVSGLLSKEDKQKLNGLSNAVLDGTGLMRIDGSTSMQGNLNLAGQRVVNVKNPEADTDAVNRRTMNAAIQSVSQGFLRIDGIVPMAANLSMGNRRIVSLRSPEQRTDAANKDYVDNQIYNAVNGFLPTNGTGRMTGMLSLNNQIIRGVRNPSEPSDAVNKSYMESYVGNTGVYYLKRDGSYSMTGNLNVGDNRIKGLKRSEHATDAVNRQELDEVRSTVLGTGDFKKDGSVPLTGNINASSRFKITNMDYDAAYGDSDAVPLGYMKRRFIQLSSGGNQYIQSNTALILNSSSISINDNPSQKSYVVRKQYVDDTIASRGCGAFVFCQTNGSFNYMENGVLTQGFGKSSVSFKWARGTQNAVNPNFFPAMGSVSTDYQGGAMVTIFFHNIGDTQSNLPDDLQIWTSMGSHQGRTTEGCGADEQERIKLNGRSNTHWIPNIQSLYQTSIQFYSNYNSRFWFQITVVVQPTSHGYF